MHDAVGVVAASLAKIKSCVPNDKYSGTVEHLLKARNIFIC